MRNKSFFETIVFETPWQITIVIGVVLYILSFFVKNINTGLISVGPVISTFLKIFSIFLLIAGILSALRTLLNKNLLKNTKSIEDIKKLSWKEFEDIIETYYREKGYEVIHTGYNSADGGIDLIAKKENEKVIIQCKHWKAYKVDVKVIREIYGLMVDEKASKAVVITSGDFTEPAKEFAYGKPIELINREKLVNLIDSTKNKIQSENTQKNTDKNVILCPNCHAPMVLRVAKQGEHAGKKFWGCSNYPKCKCIIDLS